MVYCCLADIQRHVATTLWRTNPYPGRQALVALLRYARAYYRNQHHDTDGAMHAYQPELNQWSPPTPESIRRRLDHYPTLVIPPTATFVRAYLAPYHAKLVVVKTYADQQHLFARRVVAGA